MVIAVSTPHRNDGCFEACRYAIERLKAVVPIWKQENWSDGQVWVEGPRQRDLDVSPGSSLDRIAVAKFDERATQAMVHYAETCDAGGYSALSDVRVCRQLNSERIWRMEFVAAGRCVCRGTSRLPVDRFAGDRVAPRNRKWGRLSGNGQLTTTATESIPAGCETV